MRKKRAHKDNKYPFPVLVNRATVEFYAYFLKRDLPSMSCPWLQMGASQIFTKPNFFVSVTLVKWYTVDAHVWRQSLNNKIVICRKINKYRKKKNTDKHKFWRAWN